MRNNSVTFVVRQLDVLELSIHYSRGCEVWGRLADLCTSRGHGVGGKRLRERQNYQNFPNASYTKFSWVEL